jgi:molecular chaperone DnaK (HSP70)
VSTDETEIPQLYAAKQVITTLNADLSAAREALEKLAYLSRNRTTTRIMLRDHIAAAIDAAKETKP